MKFLAKIKNYKFLLMTVATVGLMSSCTEEIDTSNRFSLAEGEYTVLGFLEEGRPEDGNSGQFTEYVELLHKVPISAASESTVAQLLSTRGNYTCFAPNNQAIYAYLDTLYKQGIISQPSWDGFGKDERGQKDLDSIRKVIVYNSIINSGDLQYFETADMEGTDKEEWEFPLANMKDRKLKQKRGKTDNNAIIINGADSIHKQHRDIEAINGRVHEMLGVIAPSDVSMAELLMSWIQDGNKPYTVMAKLVLACGLADTLAQKEDEVYYQLRLNKNNDGGLKDMTDRVPADVGSGALMDHRYYGFTIFAETDDMWSAAIGKAAADITVEDVKDWLVGLQAAGAFSGATTGTDYDNINNIVNQFITYHILPEKLDKRNLVIHYNELGYNAATKTPTVACTELYTTMGKRRLLKIFESYESQGIYLNRFPVLRNGRGKFSEENAPTDADRDNYHESGEFKDIASTDWAMYPDENIGVKVNTSVATDTEAGVESDIVNGIIYPIDRFLIYSTNVQQQLKRQRMRFEIASIFPEFMNNDIRNRDKQFTSSNPNASKNDRCFPVSYPYVTGLKMKEGTRFYYLSGYGYQWLNWQRDEFNIVGDYEFTMKLPPVPAKGHYELRFAVQSESNKRGMCQVYWGDNENNLPAAGIPLDVRMSGTSIHLGLSGVTDPKSIVGWVRDDPEDQAANDENDKIMRNNGFMKAPKHYTRSPGSMDPMRNNENKLRRIIVSADMDPDKTYYMKFKSVLEDKTKEFYMDYFEYCAKEVYDNPIEAEDLW